MSEPFTAPERTALLAHIAATEDQLYARNGQPKASPRQLAELLDLVRTLLGEYADRLPRVLMSACPFTGASLKRSLDPFGFDGPWWHSDRTFTPEEPAAPPSFRCILGALDLRGRVPVDAQKEVLAGPDVPFVAPRLLELPGMIAVMHRIELRTGDVAYPIAYFSPEAIHPGQLHQHWTRPDLWFKTPEGRNGWIISNDRWDFDLEPWIAQGKLRWLRVDGENLVVLGAESGEACPYVALQGDRKSQVLGGGERGLESPPSGKPASPFED